MTSEVQSDLGGKNSQSLSEEAVGSNPGSVTCVPSATSGSLRNLWGLSETGMWTYLLKEGTPGAKPDA